MANNKHYSEDFKQDVVEYYYSSGKSQKEAAKDCKRQTKNTLT